MRPPRVARNANAGTSRRLAICLASARGPKSLMLRQAFKNLLLFLIAFGVLLFLPAWSLTWAQGWIFIGLLGVLSTAITLYLAVYDPALLERRLKAGPGAEQERSQKIIQLMTSAML